MKKDKQFTPHQLARLPDQGYLIENCHGSKDYICIMNGYVKYNRNGEWNTLTWTCCPTRKQMTYPEKGYTYSHYPDYASFSASNPGVGKAPNDF